MQQEIIIDNSVEQYKLTTDEFVYAQADGNYTRIYITHPEADKDSGTVTVTMQMGQLIRLIDRQLINTQSTLARLGNSYIINLDYVFHIKPAERRLTLRDWSGRTYQLDHMPVNPLKQLKAVLLQRAGGASAENVGEDDNEKQ